MGQPAHAWRSQVYLSTGCIKLSEIKHVVLVIELSWIGSETII